MLSDFRALGGVAENIRAGSAGSGLYAVDPALPVTLRVPPNLCFETDDIEFVDGHMALKATANVSAGERKFFESYARAFSWGAGGEAESTKFLAMLAALPSDVRAVMENELQMADSFEPNPAGGGRGWFLRSRRFRLKGRDCFVPVAELARHGVEGLVPSLDGQGCLQIAGKAAGEILVPRGPYDTLGVFRNFGTVAPQNLAYSISLRIKREATDLVVGRNASRAVTRGAFLVPQIDSGGQTLTFSYLMIGHTKFPRLSRGIFVGLARENGLAGADRIFDEVLFLNRMKYLALIGALEPHAGETAAALRKVAHTQLERISHCMGTREI